MLRLNGQICAKRVFYECLCMGTDLDGPNRDVSTATMVFGSISSMFPEMQGCNKRLRVICAAETSGWNWAAFIISVTMCV